MSEEQEDTENKDTENIVKTVREKYHAGWSAEEKPLNPVEGLEKEHRETSSKGKGMLFLGFVFLIVSVAGVFGIIEVENSWMLPVVALLTGAFVAAGVALKMSVKDIEYMKEAEQEVDKLKSDLKSMESGRVSTSAKEEAPLGNYGVSKEA